MREILDARAARGKLRREILRRGGLYWAAPALLTVGLTLVVIFDVALISTERYDKTRALDGDLRAGLFLTALALILVLMRGDHSGLRRLLQRLPVPPIAILQARLQLALAFGGLAFSALLAAEYFARPTMMHPNFPDRLNPAEEETFRRLPGIPLMRFKVDGRVTHALASELSEWGLRRAGPNTGVWKYGTAFRWAPYPTQPASSPRPGESLATFGKDDWARANRSEKRRLSRLGLPDGAEVEITLDRYVSRAEYLAEPWRRDGLMRERKWHGIDRAVGFLATLVLTLCAAHLIQLQLWPASSPIAIGFLLLLGFISDFGDRILRKWLLFSDLDRVGRPMIPTFGPHQDPYEHMAWPLFLVAACALVYSGTLHKLRSAGSAHVSHEKTAKRLPNPRPGSKLEQVLTALAVLVAIGWFAGTIEFDAQTATWLIWLLALCSAVSTVFWLNHRWTQRDPLLSRLPISPDRVAGRRLAKATGALVILALVPLGIEQLVTIEQQPPAGEERLTIQLTPRAGTWAESLVILASGQLFLLLALLGRSKIAARLAVVFSLYAAMAAMLLLGTRTAAPPIVYSSLFVILAAPFASHLLLRRRAELGRAPRLSELRTAS